MWYKGHFCPLFSLKAKEKYGVILLLKRNNLIILRVMLIAGSFSSVCVYVSRSISKKIKHAGNYFREGKNPIDLQNYKSYKSKILIGHKIIARINLFFCILCHSAIVQVEVKESRLDICFCHGSRSQWPSAQCIFMNICLLRLMVMNLWKRQPPPPLFLFLATKQ